MEDLEKLDAIAPKRPPTKQARVDALLPHIEQKIALGVTLDQMREALFPDLSYNTFQTMLWRARAKRDKRDALASGETPAGPGLSLIHI